MIPSCRGNAALGGSLRAQRASTSERPSSRKLGASDGFAAVDALVALTILAATIALSLEAAASATHAAASASEVREADTLLRYLLQSHQGDEGGRSDRFAWRVEVTPLGPVKAGGTFQLCKHAAQARDQRSGRRYTLATLVACPAEGAA
jgi:hypothetical protein